MKKISTTLAFITALLSMGRTASAQDKTEGKIKYTITMNIHANLKPDQLQYKDMLPETATQDAWLIFKGQKFKTYFSASEKKEDDGVEMDINIQSENGNELYVDLDKQLQWSNKDGKMEQAPLKIHPGKVITTNETKQILGYDCKKIILPGEKKDSTILWYTTQLPLKAGSVIGIFTDKGVVLEMQQKKIGFVADSITFAPQTAFSF